MNTLRPNRSLTIIAICPPGDIASDRRFANLFEIWLEGDHYTWCAMRVTGDA